MEKFSKWKDKKKVKEKILFENDILKVRDIEGWSVIDESDSVVCIPYLIDEDKFVIRQEYVPSYKYVNKKEYHLTILSGTIEEGEQPDETLRRELVEEAGIKLNESYKIKLEEPLFISKGNINRFYYTILPLTKNDFTDTVATTDGSKNEMLSKSIKVDIKQIDKLKPSDIITKMMLLEFKNYLKEN